MQFNREQMISIGALCLLLLACVFAVGWSLQVRSEANYELTERREALSHLEARARSGTQTHARMKSEAPAAAFLDAPTVGLAAAQLQAYLSQVAASQQAILISYGVEPTRREDLPELDPSAGHSRRWPDSTAELALSAGKPNALRIR